MVKPMWIEKGPDECWPWTGAKRQNGYGHKGWRGKQYLAHRWMYERRVGPIPEGMVVCHACDNKWCVNPAHLFVGTQKDNVRDMYAKNRQADRKGEKCGTSKLTEKEVLEIRAASDAKNVALAKQYGVSASLISQIRNRKTWTHI